MFQNLSVKYCQDSKGRIQKKRLVKDIKVFLKKKKKNMYSIKRAQKEILCLDLKSSLGKLNQQSSRVIRIVFILRLIRPIKKLLLFLEMRMTENLHPGGREKIFLNEFNLIF